ncbi:MULTISPECIES: NAD-dependent dehydratase [unclassified Clostridium]|uniref:NAD-dependent dehydratase n=1 Tax=unclassified Clostridium TaxID=2614128 RepID=UPI0018996DC8|nr:MULTISPECIES: NAD-dependent dehydratase [unclassified Clostridium]MCR1950300.1 NAD-dependent dehydratase [Clostridium sp. DSM 100503]
MKDRAIIFGSSDNFLIYFIKYVILKNIETYLVLMKNEEIDIIKDIEKEVTIIRFDGNIEHLKLLLKSIEPKVIYNLYDLSLEDKYEIKDIISSNYLNIILILEALTTSTDTKLINLVSKSKVNEEGNPLNLYSAVQKSLESIILYYKNIYNINTSIVYKTGDVKLDLEKLYSF